MRMAQNYKMTANFLDGFDADETGKSGIIYAGCFATYAPKLPFNLGIMFRFISFFHVAGIFGGGNGRRHGAVGVLDLWA